MFQFCSRLILGLACVAGITCGAVFADEKDVVIDISSPKRSKYPIATVNAQKDSALSREIKRVIDFDLDISSWFRILEERGFLEKPSDTIDVIDVEAWKSNGAFGVIKYKVVEVGPRVELEFRLFEIEKDSAPLLSLKYSGAKEDIRRLTHKFCDKVVEHFTGESGFFASSIVFSTRSGRGPKKIVSIDFDGANLKTLTKSKWINILPAFSPDGNKVLFTSFQNQKTSVVVKHLRKGTTKRVSAQKGMNVGGSWSPDGSQIALTLSKDGNSEIYVVNAQGGGVVRRLTNHKAIDTSPAWSPSGKEIAFVSDREGGPQVFVMSANGSNIRRVSMNGAYNTTPAWSPRLDERRIAYTTRDEKTFDIVTLDLDTKKMVRITQREGVNEEPTFSPNGRVLAFSSFREGKQGVYLVPANGKGTAKRVWKGKAFSLDWGPSPSSK